MIDRDKVISRLQIIRTWADVGKKYNGIQGEDCLRDVVDWIDDALALLKAQEPRVLTLEEVLSFGAIYMDEPSNPTCLRMLYCYEVERDHGHIFVDSDGDKILYPAKEFNKTWRCWSSRPTKQQREAVKWDD